jgi:RNA polymerase sigma-70 factor (ECF subfamily)
MDDTPASLLERLRGPTNQEAWTRFTRLYTPLLFHWVRRLGLGTEDAADLVQDVLVTLVRELPRFEYDRGGSFRNWLRTVTLNRWRNSRRRRVERVLPAAGPGPEDVPAADPIPEIDEAEYRRYLVGRALEVMQTQFQTNTWRACWEHTVRDRPAADVAAELGLSEGAVYVATSRVLRRLREELRGLLD